MLVPSRKPSESIIGGDRIRITVVGLRGYHIRPGIETFADVAIKRRELLIPAIPYGQATSNRAVGDGRPDGSGA